MRACAWCGRGFVPRHDRRTRTPQRFCRRACYVAQMRQQGRDGLLKAQQVRKAQMNAAVRARLQAAFGVLTERELDVFRHAWRDAYARGYRQGWHRAQGKAVAA